MPLVSIIIPCYNAERWLKEAIESCLAQTYACIEVIVVDDGSTDASLSIARAYQPDVLVVTEPNRGSSFARNRGFSLAQGDLIQFLDSDDYLLPEKLERQVEYLECEGGDVVYGDWQHLFHRTDGSSALGPLKIAGAHDDVLHALLGGWWIACLAPLHRREVIERVGGWNETLHEVNDWEFFMTEAMSHVDIRYQPGCYSVYRRYGNTTLSTANPLQSMKNSLLVLTMAERELAQRGTLSPRYREALAQSYYRLARSQYDSDRAEYERLVLRASTVSPDFTPRGTRPYELVQRALGMHATDRLAHYKRRARRLVKRP